MTKVDRRQALAYRIAAHGLHRDSTDLGVLDLGVQYVSVPATAQSLAARLPAGAGEPADLVTAWSFRGAPHLLRRSDVDSLARELWPRSDVDALARLGGEAAVLRRAGVAGLDAFHTTARELRDIVTEERTKGEVSAELTTRLPAPYNYDCRGCGTTHVYNTLFQSMGLAAGVQVVAGSRPTLLAPIPDRAPLPTESAGAQRVILAYLRLYGPATVAQAAGYLGTTQAQAREMWPADVAEVDLDGRTAYVPADQVTALRRPPAPDVVRLLPPLDPFLQLRDRELLVPDEARRKAVWKILGNPGAVLAGGEIVGTWRPGKASKKRLELVVTAFEPLPAAARRGIEAEAAVVAGLRGSVAAEVTFSG